MAGGGTETTVTAPPAATVEEPEVVTLDLAEGTALEDFLDEVSEAVQPPDEPKPEPTPAPPAAPAPAPTATAPTPTPAAPPSPEPGKMVPIGVVQGERTRRKRAEARNAYYEGVLANIEEERKAGAKHAGGRPPVHSITLDKPSLDAARAKATELGRSLSPELGESGSDRFSKGLVEITQAQLEESARLIQEATNKTVTAVDARIAITQENELREELAEEGLDYDDILRRSGVFAALQPTAQGQFSDPAIAREIYRSANFAKKAFKIAVATLRKRGEWRDPDEADPPAAPTVVPPAPPAAAAPSSSSPTPGSAAPAPTADALAEAERAGARRVTDQLVTAANRPRGVRHLTPAGSPPQTILNASAWDSINKRLDSPSEDVRNRMLEFLDRNPAVDEWFMRGRPTA